MNTAMKVLLSAMPMLTSCTLLFFGLNAGDRCDPEEFLTNCSDANPETVTDGNPHGFFHVCEAGVILNIPCGIEGCNADKTSCSDVCGDSAITGTEECDPKDGIDEPCDALTCQRIPFCGDKEIDFPEQCEGAPVGANQCGSDCQLIPLPELEPNDDFIVFNHEPEITQDTIILGDQSSPQDRDFYPLRNNSTQELPLRLDVYSVADGYRRPCSAIQLGAQPQSSGLTVLDTQGQLIADFPIRDDGFGGPGDACAGGDIRLQPGQLVYLLVLSDIPYLLDVDVDGQIVCGDGNVDLGEDCEPPSVGICSSTCKRIEGCGNGFLEEGEQCDDENLTRGDGCDEDCQREDASEEQEPNEDGATAIDTDDFSIVSAEGPFTGDALLLGAIEPAGDEDVFALHNDQSTPLAFTLDVFEPALGPSERCSFGIDTLLLLRDASGNVVDQNNDKRDLDGCSQLRLSLLPGQTLYAQLKDSSDLRVISAYAIAVSVQESTCGDGDVDTGEECDDSNLTNEDGCSSDCAIEGCGDGLVQLGLGETCDDGDTTDGDGCDSSCQLDAALVNEQEPNDNGTNAQLLTQDALVFGSVDTFLETDAFRVKNTTASVQRVRLALSLQETGLNLPCQKFTQIDFGGTPDGSQLLDRRESNNGACNIQEFILAPNQEAFFVLQIVTDPYFLLLDFLTCGNGEIEFGEECEQPGANGCDASCQRVPVCGDDHTDVPELCDDGNTQAGDGCDANCQLEGSFDALEQEPNDDGFPSIIVSSDFSAEDATNLTTFRPNQTFLGALNPAGDDDIYKLQNTGTELLSVRIDTYHPVLGVGKSCGIALDTRLIIRDTDTFVSQLLPKGSFDRVTGQSNGPEAGDDLCGGMLISIAPGDALFLQVLSEKDDVKIPAYLLVIGLGFDDATCGDGIMTPPENCDDGDTISGDGCSSLCQVENLVVESEPNDDGTPSSGGNGQGNDFDAANANGPFTGNTIIAGAQNVHGDEDIFAVRNDDVFPRVFRFDTYNTFLGLGVSCGFTIRSVINLRDASGNLLAKNERRDEDNDFCSGLFFTLQPGQTVFAQVLGDDDFSNFFAVRYLFQIRLLNSICGNGTLEEGEGCEPPNTATCDASCQGINICGDGVLAGAEFCDDGNTTNGDGCDASCQLEVGFSCPADQTLLQFAATDTPKDIPDNNTGGVTSTITLNDSRLIKKAMVTIGSITHTFDGDLDLSLISPSGANIALSLGHGGDGDNYTTTLFDSSCATPIIGGDAPFTGCFKPDSSLAVLQNQTLSGAWRLKVVDHANADTGALNSWSIGFCVAGAAVCGDGNAQAPEECDDGNLLDGDGCNASCAIEVCGDGILHAALGEECDDANNQNNDGCDNDCIHRADLTETEPNDDGSISLGGSSIDGNDFSSANANGPFSQDTTLFAALSPAGDEDVFAISNPTASALNVRLDLFSAVNGLGAPCDGSADTGLNIRDAAGSLLAQNDDRSAQDSCSGLDVTLAPGETVFAHITEFKDNEIIPGYFVVIDFQ